MFKGRLGPVLEGRFWDGDRITVPEEGYFPESLFRVTGTWGGEMRITRSVLG